MLDSGHLEFVRRAGARHAFRARYAGNGKAAGEENGGRGHAMRRVSGSAHAGRALEARRKKNTGLVEIRTGALRPSLYTAAVVHST
jgi:hypothetical protein